MGKLPWSSTRGRPHPQGGRAGLPPGGPAEDSAPADFEVADPEVADPEVLDPEVLDPEVADPEVVAAWQVVRAVATAPPSPAELVGLETALGHFRVVVPVSTVTAPSERRRREGRRTMTPATLGSRLGVAAAGVLLLGFGGVGAFALTGSLSEGEPGALPAVAPTTEAPHGPTATPVADGDDDSDTDSETESDDTNSDDTHSDDTDSDRQDSDESTAEPSGAPTKAVGPDATGPAAFGLCNAWSHAKPSKQTATHSIAFRNLVAAAGGQAKVEAYCASVQHPSGKAGKTVGKAEKSAAKAEKSAAKADKSEAKADKRSRKADPSSKHPSGKPSMSARTGKTAPRG